MSQALRLVDSNNLFVPAADFEPAHETVESAYAITSRKIAAGQPLQGYELAFHNNIDDGRKILESDADANEIDRVRNDWAYVLKHTAQQIIEDDASGIVKKSSIAGNFLSSMKEKISVSQQSVMDLSAGIFTALRPKSLLKRAYAVGASLKDPQVRTQMYANFGIVCGSKLAVMLLLGTQPPVLAAAISIGIGTVLGGAVKTYFSYKAQEKRFNEGKPLVDKNGKEEARRSITGHFLRNAGWGLVGSTVGTGLGILNHEFFGPISSWFGPTKVNSSAAFAAIAAGANDQLEKLADVTPPAPTLDKLPVTDLKLEISPIDVAAEPTSPIEQFKALIANDTDVKQSVLKDLTVAQDVNASDAARSHAMANLSYYSLHGKSGVSIDHATAYALSKEALELNPNNTGAQQFKDYMETNTEVGKAAHAAEVQAKIENFVPDAKPLNLAFEGNVTDILENGSNQEKMALAHALFNGDANYEVDGQPMPIQSSPKDAVAILKDLAADGYKPAQVALDKLPGDLDSYKTSRLPENVSAKIAELTAPPTVEPEVAVKGNSVAEVEALRVDLVDKMREQGKSLLENNMLGHDAGTCLFDSNRPNAATCYTKRETMLEGDFIRAVHVNTGTNIETEVGIVYQGNPGESVSTLGFMKNLVKNSYNSVMGILGVPQTVAASTAPALKM